MDVARDIHGRPSWCQPRGTEGCDCIPRLEADLLKSMHPRKENSRVQSGLPSHGGIEHASQQFISLMDNFEIFSLGVTDVARW